MKYTSVKNPVYINTEGTAIQVLVKFDDLTEEVLFIARNEDAEAHGRELYTKAIAGAFGTILTYMPTIETLEQKWAKLKVGITLALDVKAKQLDFDSFAEALSYCEEPEVPLYQRQALALRKWRSLCWARFDEIVATNKDFDVIDSVEALPVFVLNEV